MADIFISYSKVDHALASKLSAFLELKAGAFGGSLGAADLYQDEIMKQLVSARAVITIWTENSIKSDWVRAEAGAAKKDGKLIPGLLMLPTPTFRCHSGRCTRRISLQPM